MMYALSHNNQLYVRKGDSPLRAYQQQLHETEIQLSIRTHTVMPYAQLGCIQGFNMQNSSAENGRSCPCRVLFMTTILSEDLLLTVIIPHQVVDIRDALDEIYKKLDRRAIEAVVTVRITIFQ
jgi:hypothetical protein